ncbi:hypothetical protein DPMN_003588, partial [Dreissena polymorpha]
KVILANAGGLAGWRAGWLAGWLAGWRAGGISFILFKSNPATTLTTCFDQRAFSVSTISDQKVGDDCLCLLKEEVEERVRRL